MERPVGHEQPLPVPNQFRMDLMLKNAASIRQLGLAITDNPDLSPTQLHQRLQEKGTSIDSEFANNFVASLLKTRRQVRTAQKVSEYVGKAEENRYSTDDAQKLFQVLTEKKGKVRKPKGNISVTDSPLGIVIHCEDEADYAAFDNFASSGLYFSQYTYNATPIAGLTQPVPVIAINGSAGRRKDVIMHEFAHGENKAFMDADAASHTRKVMMLWEPLSPSYSDISKIVRTVQNQWAQLGRPIEKNGKTVTITPEILMRQPEWKSVLAAARHGAKDELLAYLAELNAYEEDKMQGGPAKDRSYKDFILNKAKLLRMGKLYDYFKDFGLDPNSDLYRYAWAEHRETISAALQAIDPIVSTYQQFAFTERMRLFRWVLAAIPLNEWSTQMAETFKPEAKLLQRAAKADPFFATNTPNTTPLRYSPKAVEFYQQMTAAGAQATTPIGLCFLNQDKPFSQYLPVR